MSPLAPGTYVQVSAAASSPNGNSATGTWFVTGLTQQGPTGVAIPLGSLSDYTAYCGPRYSNPTLYDSLNEFFSDGGVKAYVSRVVGPGATTASVSIPDQDSVTTLNIVASGAGSWGNELSVTVATGSVANTYTLTVNLNTIPVLTSPNLFTPTDAVTYFASLPLYQALVVVTSAGSGSTPPANNPANGTYTFLGGTDNDSGITETQWTNALTAFVAVPLPGQVSAPGHTTSLGYQALITHAQTNNRVALLDDADTPTASNIVSQAVGIQTQAQANLYDPSYAALLAPWIVIPGITTTTPGSASPVPTRTVPPSAFVAAIIARSDQTNTANVPAAGANGVSNYAIGVTQAYNATDRGTLNAAGVDVTRLISGAVTLFGYRSLSLDPNWYLLNWVRFRMQIVNDFDEIGDGFIFSDIDGKGQIFSTFGGALAGKCQQYWLAGSLYGQNAQDAFSINVGPQVNTPTTIAAGQLNAQVALIMAPAAEFVIINVVKFLSNVSLPTTNSLAV